MALDNGGALRPSEEFDTGEANASAFTGLPIHNSMPDRITFKRKPKLSQVVLPRFIGSLFVKEAGPPTSAPLDSRLHTAQPQQRPQSNEVDSTDFDVAGTSTVDDSKDSSGFKFYTRLPGHRARYEELAAIDWMLEYARERQRLRTLYSNATGLLGHLLVQIDSCQIWFVLIATGIASGVVAGTIGVISDWLGDLKSGYCKAGSDDGKFYLNRSFCCLGYQEFAQCPSWISWSDAFGLRSVGGAWVIEFLVYTVFSVLFAACASILVTTYAIHAKHSGIPEIKTILGGFRMQHLLGTWTLLIKSLGLCLATASGLWLGKEGPLVHLACCMAHLLMKPFRTLSDNEARKREVFSAAAAAGISVAFGSPIGGVLFSLEQLSYYFPNKTMWQSFVCAMVAAVSLQAFNPFRTGKLVLYQVTYHSQWHSFEMVLFVILGILGGIYGGLLIKLNMRIVKWRQRAFLLNYPVLEVALVSWITALINYPIKFMRVQSSELVYTLFAECSDSDGDQLGLCKSGSASAGVVALLLVAAIFGTCLSALTFGLRIPAGIILPSMAIGALYGRAIGLIAETLQLKYPASVIFSTCEQNVQCITPGTYAIIGAASALGGATRMTVSIVVIMFELTGALTYVLPIMIAVMISKWVGDWMEKRGIYESWIQLHGYPVLNYRHGDENIPDISSSQVMTSFETLVVITSTGHTVGSLMDLLSAHTYRGFPVVNSIREALLLGYVSRVNLAITLQRALSSSPISAVDTEVYFSYDSLLRSTISLDFTSLIEQTPVTLDSRASLYLTIDTFERLGLREILFVQKGKLGGLLTKKDIYHVLQRKNHT